MELTAEGQRLFGYVRDGFARLGRGMEDVRASRRGRMLTVSVHPACLRYWVIPRSPISAAASEIDEACCPTPPWSTSRATTSTWPCAMDRATGRASSRQLMDEEVFPVCSPRFNKGVLPKQPRDLADRRCCAMRGSPGATGSSRSASDLPEPERGPVYNEPSLVLQAAIAGQGVALSPAAALARPAIEAGHLVRLFPRGGPRAVLLLYRLSARRCIDPARCRLPRLAAGQAGIGNESNSGEAACRAQRFRLKAPAEAAKLPPPSTSRDERVSLLSNPTRLGRRCRRHQCAFRDGRISRARHVPHFDTFSAARFRSAARSGCGLREEDRHQAEGRGLRGGGSWSPANKATITNLRWSMTHPGALRGDRRRGDLAGERFRGAGALGAAAFRATTCSRSAAMRRSSAR